MENVHIVDQSFLAGKGLFYVGGEYVEKDGKHIRCHQMFVEVYEPKEIRCPYPVIFLHGAGQTNVCWLMTPDGRMGWCDYFLKNGFVVCLAEQPARARSAYHPSVDGPSIYHPVEGLQEHFMDQNGFWPQTKLHTQWPGSAEDWEDETFRQFADSQVEYLPSNTVSQKLVLEAGGELLQKTGPAILLTHSQAGPFGWLLADRYPKLVRGIAAVEPSGPPFTRDLKDGTAHDYGLAGLPLHFEPPVDQPEEIETAFCKAPDALHNDGWIMKEPARQLPNLKGIPIVMLTGEASYHAGYDYLLSTVLSQAGVEHDYVNLGDVGIHGNGHMMMLEKNNLEIADWIIRWLNSHVK